MFSSRITKTRKRATRGGPQGAQAATWRGPHPWPLPRTPSAKIGELHTTLYLCFLVLLVYLLVFIFVSFIKIYKKNIYLTVSSPPCLDEHVRTRFFAGIGSSRFPSKGWRKYEEGMGQNIRST